MGSDINIKVVFKTKKQGGGNTGVDSKPIEGTVAVTVVPETEAEYPGGFKQITGYLRANVFNKISGATASEKIQQAIVKFTVNENGEILEAKISKTSTDPTIDNLILNAINKMPKWKPAENANGIKVKQEMTIPFGSGGC